MNDAEIVKSKIDIVDFISSYVTLKKAGRNFKALCPFHSEKTPSFTVSPERQSWHCFGACATGGDAITFYEKWEGIDFLEALKSLAEKTGVTLQNYAPAKDIVIKEKIYAINNFASDFYHYLLTSHPIGRRARDYLKSRNIKKEIIDNFRLGYAPESWDSLSKYMTKKGFTNSELADSGLMVKSEKESYYDRFRGRLIFTLHDHSGKIIGFSGRSLPARRSLGEGGRDENESGAKYINTPETPLYIKGNCFYGLDKTKDAIKKEGFAIIVEGEFDFLASFQSGITNIVAIKGSALTQNQSLLIKRYTEAVVLALDSDFAGNQAAKRGIEIAEKVGLSVKVIKLLKGKDPAECIDFGSHFWKQSVEKAVSIYDFIIDNACEKYDSKDISGKKKISDEVIPFLAKIQNPIIASHYIKKLSSLLAVSEESVDTALDQYIRKLNLKIDDVKVDKTKKDRSELLEEHFLSLILQSEIVKEMLKVALEIVTVDDFRVLPIMTILKLLRDYLAQNDKFDIKLFNELITPEIANVFDRSYLADMGSFSSDPKQLEKEILKTAKEIKKISLRRMITQISTKIHQIDNKQNGGETGKFAQNLKEMFQELNKLEK